MISKGVYLITKTPYFVSYSFQKVNFLDYLRENYTIIVLYG